MKYVFLVWRFDVTHLSQVPYEDIVQDLMLIGIVGIEDPLRESVRKAVEDCQKAGIVVKMCTGDNVLTAHSIAVFSRLVGSSWSLRDPFSVYSITLKCSRTFFVFKFLPIHHRKTRRFWSRSFMHRVKLLASREMVQMTTAHVGIAGTEVAKEASDIILMDNNFSSIVKAIMWGRCINDAVRKFLEFQISINVTMVVITFVTAVVTNSETSAVSAIQLLWIDIITDTFAALALARRHT